MALTLYVGSKRYSSWSLRAYLALTHTGTAFETKTIVLDQADSKTNILAVNPAGRVPVLFDGDLVIHDSLAICEYVNELVPAAQLWPADRAQRARARALSAEMHSGFVALRSNMPLALGHDELRGRGHTPETLADAQRIQTIWREALGASGGPFLFGAFTIADAMFAPVTARFTIYGVDVDATARAYIKTILTMPAFRDWHADAMQEPTHPL